LAGAAFAFANARQSIHPAFLILGLAPFLVAFVYTSKIAQRFATLVPLSDSDVVEFPVEKFQKELALDALENPIDDASIRVGTPWTCTACGESNPGNFDTCWRCSSDDRTVA
jgi:hypothetical protein